MLSALKLFWGIALVCLIAACGGSGTASTPKAKTTLLVYMIGSDLESRGGEATANIAEMMRVGSTNEVNIVLQTGGANKAGWTTVQRKKVFKDRVELIADLGQPSMVQADTLRDFIQWGMAQYPSERYMLALWDHGGGPNGGFGVDEIAGDGSMGVPALQSALQGALGSTGKKLELIGFDACLMASVEVAHALAPFAKYMAASQEVEPGAGWDWEVLLRRLSTDPLVSGAALGKSLADGYLAKMQRIGDESIVTFSITDLSRIPALVGTLEVTARAWSSRLATEGADAWILLAYGRQHALDFSSAKFFGPMVDVVDIGSFFGQSAMDHPGIERAQVLAALDAAVTYKVHGSALHNHPPTGLHMYFPVKSILDDATQGQYRALAFSAPIQQWVDHYVDMAHSDVVATPVVEAPGQAGAELFARLSNTNYAIAFATMENASGVVYALKRAETSYANGVAMMSSVLNTDWFSIDGVPVSLLPQEAQRTVIGERFTIPVAILNDAAPPTAGLLGVTYSRDPAGVESYEIQEFYEGDSGYSAVAQRSTQLPPGTRLAPMGYVVASNLWQPQTDMSFVVPDNVATTKWRLTKGALAPVAGARARLGVADFLTRLHLSTPVTP